MTCLAAIAATSGLWIQTAKVDITPEVPLSLGGYTERGDAVFGQGSTRLYARTVLFSGPQGQFALVVIDSLTVPESLQSATQALSPVGCTVTVVATHTHCAPDSQRLNDRMTFKVPGIATFDRKWLDWTARRLAGSVRAALDADSKPVSKLDVVVWEPGLNRGRRKNANPDPRAWALLADGRPILAGYAAHPTLLEQEHRQLDGDWPGRLAERLGCAVVGGAIGDVSPKPVGNGGVENLPNYVENLAAGLARARPVRVWVRGDSWGWDSARVRLGPPSPHPGFGQAYGVPVELAKSLIGRFAPSSAMLRTLKLGSLAVVLVPGEPCAALGRKIGRSGMAAGFPHTFTVSHAGGWIGYILSPKDYDTGGYEATLSFHGRDTADRVAEAARSALSSGVQPRSVARSCAGQSRY